MILKKEDKIYISENERIRTLVSGVTGEFIQRHIPLGHTTSVFQRTLSTSNAPTIQKTWLYLVPYGNAYDRVDFGAIENVKCRGIEVVLSMITINCVSIGTIKCVKFRDFRRQQDLTLRFKMETDFKSVALTTWP